ncbi:hypothetical protein D6764_03475 [Candidatus Woesearchaeota archaeon]|nr:MAG: hypothetical protein D6764_03475 [Candidatus Woesearchaeota archaeon]
MIKDKRLRACFFVLLGLFMVVRLFLLFRPHVLYWDAAVYIGMAKHIYSAGSAGLWEPIRPLVWPLILGIPWYLGLDIVLSGHLMQVMFSFGLVLLTFLLAKEYGGEKSALFASSVMAFSGFFIFLNYRLLTEIPAAFFAVLAVYLYIKKKPFLSGFAAGISFLTKFPFGIFLPVVVLADLRQVKRWTRYAVGFAIPSSAYLLLNTVLYSDPLAPLLEAARVIRINVGCNITFAQPWYMYLQRIPFDNWLFPLSLLAIVPSAGNFRSNLIDRVLILSIVLPLLYLFQLSCRDFRFAMLFLPFLAVLAGKGIHSLFIYLSRKLSMPHSRFFIIFFFAVLFLSAFSGISSYSAEEPPPWPQRVSDYYSFLSNPDVAGKYSSFNIFSSTPWPVVYSNAPVDILYYPNFDSEIASRYASEFRNSSKALVFYDECGGGLECPPSDVLCPSQKELLFDVLNSSFSKIVFFSHDGCRYALFARHDK